MPNSAKHRAMSMIITAPMAQEKMAAGPAMADAFSAPNSQPEPMIEPTPANRRPTTPMSRRSRVSSDFGPPDAGRS